MTKFGHDYVVLYDQVLSLELALGLLLELGLKTIKIHIENSPKQQLATLTQFINVRKRQF